MKAPAPIIVRIARASTSPFRLHQDVLALAAVFLTLLACTPGYSGPNPATAATETDSAPAELTGTASYYADKYNGNFTASGEIFDMNQMTAAHRTLPFGTKVRVTRLDNGKSVVVRINDRGPFVENRIIDLSLAAARDLDMVEKGLVRVRLEILKTNSRTTLPTAGGEKLNGETSQMVSNTGK